jgi:hypothetical protein
MLREAVIKLAGGKTTGEVCRDLGVSEQSYYRWRKEYGGMHVFQAKKLKDLERENARLKKLVAEQFSDKAILEEAPNDAGRQCGMCSSSWLSRSGGPAGYWGSHGRPSAAGLSCATMRVP